MAEVAIPVVALGAMWLINNDKKKEEKKEKMHQMMRHECI